MSQRDTESMWMMRAHDQQRYVKGIIEFVDAKPFRLFTRAAHCVAPVADATRTCGDKEVVLNGPTGNSWQSSNARRCSQERCRGCSRAIASRYAAVHRRRCECILKCPRTAPRRTVLLPYRTRTAPRCGVPGYDVFWRRLRRILQRRQTLVGVTSGDGGECEDARADRADDLAIGGDSRFADALTDRTCGVCGARARIASSKSTHLNWVEFVSWAGHFWVSRHVTASCSRVLK